MSGDSRLAKEFGSFFGQKKSTMAYFRGGKGNKLSFPSYVVLSLIMAEQCKGHIFVNAKEKASSRTRKNAYAKLQCRLFFQYDGLCTSTSRVWGFCCCGIFHTISADVQKKQSCRCP